MTVWSCILPVVIRTCSIPPAPTPTIYRQSAVAYCRLTFRVPWEYSSVALSTDNRFLPTSVLLYH